MTHFTRSASLFVLTFLLICSSLFADPKPPKWGKVSKEEISLESVPYDPDANAVIIARTGTLSYTGHGFVINHYVRIKILKAEGVEQGDVALPYYKNDKLENIRSVKAQTLEIQKDGKVIKHKLKNDQVFDVSLNENWNEVRFVMPAVKQGSIIEYSYNFYTTNYTFLEGWTFQDDIPTLFSSFEAQIPTFLNYNTLMQGSKLVKKYAEATTINKWSLTDLPALKSEPYTYNLMDYAERIRFQLHSYKTGGGSYAPLKDEEVYTDWQNIAKEMLNSRTISPYLRNRNKFAESLLTRVDTEENTGVELAQQIYQLVQQQFRWNGFLGIVADKTVKDLESNFEGNGATINLILTKLLQDAGLEAYPALISTKMHGRVNSKHAMLTQFNHLISVVVIDGTEYTLDAAGNPLPFGILPEKDLNLTALLLSEDNARWIEVKDNARTNTMIACYADLNTRLHKISFRWYGYDALNIADKIDARDFKQYFNNSQFTPIEDSTSIRNNISEDNLIEADVYYTHTDEWKADRVYYTLALPDALKSNPFKAETRNFPVDFGHTSSKTLVYSIKLPQDYQLEDSPENMILRTPDGQASFIYQASQMQDILTVQLKLDIKGSLFFPDSYPYLRAFFDKLINHTQQPLVLSKSAAKAAK